MKIDSQKTINSCLVLLITSLILCGCSRSTTPKANFKDGVVHSSDLVKRYGQIRSVKTEGYTDSLLMRLKAGSPNPDLPLQLIVLRSMEPAALSISGGFILLSKGLILATRTEAELAFVIAHEMAHQFIDSSDPTDTELEADRVAIQTISRSGYDPRESVSALLTSYAAIPSQGFGQQLDQGHPALYKRVAALETLLKSTHTLGMGTSDRRAFQIFKREVAVLN